MINKKLMEACQFGVLVLTAVYLLYSIYTTHAQRKESAAAAAKPTA